ncbi:transporter substrate-binding domain-containing protein [Leucobacter luti]|uniref:Glutamine transport system substrate-binding protein n=1 Tax=Leucobacter luti TaxID=340320 RepID=A0A4Q7TXI2_9MICO|nr:transporter substrate-binding domain-containing protein [Leucobacter luti]MBL3698561.1 amino acid ABC transporter substrate-binding protein [Leucobacter luti]RZT65936.1 glutamine transport system substrate-binding protein [Leucobacter luti]
MPHSHRTAQFLAALAAGALLFSATACASNGDTSESAPATDVELLNSYVVATDSSFVPFEFDRDGEHVGFDIDLITAIADEVGFAITLETTNFDGVIPGLQTGAFDLAIAGITITDERRKTVDFSDPYYRSGIIVGVPADNTDIREIGDLADRTVASRLGSAPLEYLAEHVPTATALPYEQLDQVYLAVEGGTADAVLYDAPNVEYYISTTGKGKLKTVGGLLEAQEYGIAVAPGNDDLVDAVNAALAKIIDDGRYEQIYEEWFGGEPAWLDELAGMAK